MRVVTGGLGALEGTKKMGNSSTKKESIKGGGMEKEDGKKRMMQVSPNILVQRPLHHVDTS